MSSRLFYLLTKAEAAHVERATQPDSSQIPAGVATQEPGTSVNTLMSPDHAQYLAAVDAADRTAVQAMDIVLPTGEITYAPHDAVADAEAQLAAAAEQVDAMTCGICTDEQLNTVLIDCGHLSMCCVTPCSCGTTTGRRMHARTPPAVCTPPSSMRRMR